MTGFTPDMINDRDTNITIGTSYLKLALDDFDGSMAMAAAGYNAGPGRPATGATAPRWTPPSGPKTFPSAKRATT